MRVRFAKQMFVCGTLIVGVSACALQGTAAAAAGNTTGINGSMPAFYDHEVFTINFFRLPSQSVLLAKNSQTNFIYQSDPGLPGGQPFVSVIDAIPGDGMNPLWAEEQIAFTAGHTPRQLFSDDEIAAAVASGEITLTPTNELYRCAVIGAAPRLTVGLSGASGTAVRAGTSGSGAPVTNAGSQATTWGAIMTLYK